MAKLVISGKFKAICGTEHKYNHHFFVELIFNGQIKNDFIAGIDYNFSQNKLKSTIEELENKYLNEIIGRATDENIAMYLFYKLQLLPITSLKLTEDCKNSVEITHDDFKFYNYESLLSLNKGKYFLVTGNYKKAVKEFTISILKDNKNYEAFNFRGRCYEHLKQYNKALKDFSKTIKINPSFGEAYRNRGNSYLFLKKYELMLSEFNMAVSFMPNSALAFNNRGFALQKLKKHKLAIADHTKAIKLDIQYEEAYRDRADAYIVLSMINKAKKDYKTAEKLKIKQNGKNNEISKVYFK